MQQYGKATWHATAEIIALSCSGNEEGCAEPSLPFATVRLVLLASQILLPGSSY